MNNRKPKRQPNSGRRKKTRVPVKTKQQIEFERRRAAKRRQIIKKRRAQAIRTFFNRLLMFFLIFIVMLAISIGLFFLNLFMHNDVTSADYVYQIGADDDPEQIIRYVSYNELFFSGEIHVNMSEIASLYGLIITGDTNSIRFLITDSTMQENITDDVKFYLNTSLAHINGVPTRLTSAVYKKGMNIYVPISFFNAYMTGLKIEYDVYNKKLTIINTASDNIITMKLKPGTEMENIPEASLDYNLLLSTDPNRIREAEANVESGENIQ